MNIGQKFSVTILTMLSVTFLPTLSNAQRGLTTVTPHFVDANVRAVIQGFAALGIDVVIEEGVQVQGTITLVSNVPMTPDEFRTAMTDRLRDLGYRIIYEDGVLRIGPMEP